MVGIGSIYRVRECALELLAMEEELVDSSNESWELVGQELCLKSTFLYCDLNQVIRGIRRGPSLSLPTSSYTTLKRSGDHINQEITGSVDYQFVYKNFQLGKAGKNRCLSMVQVCYNDTAQVLRQVMAAVPPVRSMETDAYWEMGDNVAE